MPRVLIRVVSAAAMAAAALGVTLVVDAAHAAGCTVMTFQFNPSAGALELSPSKLTVDAGACVTFNNQTLTTAQFTVGSSYKASAAAFSNASPNYVAQSAGSTQPVAATSTTGSAKGSIVIRPAAPASSSPAPRRTSAPPRRHSAPQPARTSPAPRPFPTPTASPPPAGVGVSPSSASTPFLAGMPTPTPSPSGSSSAAVVAGPLQPPTNRGTGLPAALAALAVVATAAGLIRVLLAEPVGTVDDRRRTVGAPI